MGEEVGSRSSEAAPPSPRPALPGQVGLQVPQLVCWLLSPEPRHSDQTEVVGGDVRHLLDHRRHPRQSSHQDLTTHAEHSCKHEDVITLGRTRRSGEALGEISTFD